MRDTFVTNSNLMKVSKVISLALLLFLQASVACVFAQDYDGREYYCLREKWEKPEAPKEGEFSPRIYKIHADDYICGYTVNGMWDFYPYGLYLMRDDDGYMMVLKYYCDDDHVQSDTIQIDSKLASRLNASVKKTLKRAVRNTTIPWSEMGSPIVTVFTKKMAADRTTDQIPDSLWLELYRKFNHTPLRPSWAPKPMSDEELEEFIRQGGQIIDLDVDLGLSVNWATCNLGAELPEEYGDYYAWGDAAHVNWGDGWRMPTKEEFAELFEKCDWADTIQNGVHGFLLTSKVSGYTSRSIFLPYNPDTIPDTTSLRAISEYQDGIYLTSDLSSIFASLCVVLRFSANEFGTTDDEIDLNIGWVDNEGILAGIKWSKIHITQFSRTGAAFIRPVCSK